MRRGASKDARNEKRDTSYVKRLPSLQLRLKEHVQQLYACRRCPMMRSTPVSGGPVVSRVVLIGQAPGPREPVLGRPFAWTAGRTMFKWFEDCAGIAEPAFRATVYMAAVCRCFPGKNQQGGDRVPSREEIEHCNAWMRAEFDLLRPELVVAVGKLAIGQFLRPVPALSRVIGQMIRIEKWGQSFDLAPLPHPSGASPWHRTEPGKALTKRAVEQICQHPAWIASCRALGQAPNKSYTTHTSYTTPGTAKGS